MSQSKRKGKATSKVEFKDVVEGDKLTIKWDIRITKIEELEEYLRPSSDRQVHKVTCAITSGPWKDREATFIILADDKVTVHPRPGSWSKLWKFLFGTTKKK